MTTVAALLLVLLLRRCVHQPRPCLPSPPPPLPAAGMPVTSVRELRVLQTCRHPNLVSLHRVVTGSFFLHASRQPAEAARQGGSYKRQRGRAVAGRQLEDIAADALAASKSQRKHFADKLKTALLLALWPQGPSWTLCSWCLSTVPTTWGGWWTRCATPSTSRRSSASYSRCGGGKRENNKMT